jgi:aminopeptidase N
MIAKIKLFTIAGLLISTFSFGQLMKKKTAFTHTDTLRGSLNSNRDWWDVMKYDITVKPDYDNKTIEGITTITYIPLKEKYTLQIDLQEPLIIDSVFYHKRKIAFKKEDKNDWILILNNLPKTKPSNKETLHGKKAEETITIYYNGKPREAVRPPWDGGWIWKKDAQNRPWMSVAVQGLGASAWYPCKDYQGDEPDNGASLTIIVPDTLVAVGNGRLMEVKNQKSKVKTDDNNIKSEIINQKSYNWVVKDPINNYNIIPYIGKYVNFTDTLQGEKGTLDLSYWVLDYNLEKAKEQFKQAKLMLRAFEYWFGPYPFYEDGYKLVEAPHLGMEHQSAIAYGNRYQNGYSGRDLSGTGWGLKWDFIIVHESGHEWFANNITTKDIADMWVHEGFTNYSETLFTEYYYGKEAGNTYCFGIRKNIVNDVPIIGPYGVNKEGSGDMYYKGANMIHSIRHAMNDDDKFRSILRGLNQTFYHQTVTTEQVEHYISKESGFDFSKVFNQYLRTTQIPVLEYSLDSTASTVTVHWTNCVNGFNLPIVITPTGKKILVTQQPQTVTLNTEELIWWNKANIERMFYIVVKRV